MAKTPNYGFEKRKKEQDRKAKKDAKREDRRLRRQERADSGESGAPIESLPTDEADDAPGEAPAE